MSEDTNRSAATGTEELQKMRQEMTLVSKSIVSARQKINMKGAVKEQEDLLMYLELPAEEEKIVGVDNLAKAEGAENLFAVMIKDIKLDGSRDSGEEANLYSDCDCERALQNFVPGGNPAHSMEITRDVFGYQVRSGSRSAASSDFDPSDIPHGRGGRGGAPDHEPHHNTNNLVFGTPFIEQNALNQEI